MISRIQKLYQEIVIEKRHRAHRRDWDADLAAEYARAGISPTRRVADRLSKMLALEKPVLLEGERIALLRTVRNLPPIFTDDEWSAVKGRHFIHEAGAVCNISPGYEQVIASGLECYRRKAEEGIHSGGLTSEQLEDLQQSPPMYSAKIKKKIESLFALQYPDDPRPDHERACLVGAGFDAPVVDRQCVAALQVFRLFVESFYGGAAQVVLTEETAQTLGQQRDQQAAHESEDRHEDDKADLRLLDLHETGHHTEQHGEDQRPVDRPETALAPPKTIDVRLVELVIIFERQLHGFPELFHHSSVERWA